MIFWLHIKSRGFGISNPVHGTLLAASIALVVATANGAPAAPKPQLRKDKCQVETKGAVVSILQRDGEVRSKHVERVGWKCQTHD